ncbi:MAG: TlpA disulfide reductase family protein [Candidatus Margulisiibacteriota bacterium]
MFRKAILIFIVLMLGFSATAKPALTTGSAPPLFSLSNLEGKTVSLDKHLGKKAIILSFFASWSKSCQQEISFLQELAKNKKIEVLGISYDRKLNDIQALAAENKLNFNILHDKKLTTLKDYRILIIPTLFVIDQSGNISSVYVDFDKNVEEAVSAEIKKLLLVP